MTLEVRIRQHALKAESVEGTAETLSSSEVVAEHEELDANFMRERNERNPLRASLSKVKPVNGMGTGPNSGKEELVGGGGAATPPPCDGLLKACGLARFVLKSVALTTTPTGTYRPGEKITDGGTKVARFVTLIGTTLYYGVISGTDFAAADTITGSKSLATSVVHGTAALTARGFIYKPQSPDNTVSYTSQVNKDGKRYLIWGARGNAQISVEGAGKLGYLNWDLQGKSSKPTDLALFTGVTLPTVVPESFLSAGVMAGADELCIDGFTFDMGNQIARRVCANDATGIKSFRITDRKPTIKLAPENALESVKDFANEYDTLEDFGFYAVIGQSATKKIALCAPAACWQEQPTGDREGIETLDTGLDLYGSESDGDDEYLIAAF